LYTECYVIIITSVLEVMWT